MDFLGLVRSESAKFLAAIDTADPAAAVPTCPGWTADDLLWHLAEVQHFWSEIVGRRMVEPDDYKEPARPADRAGLRRLFESASSALVDALDAADDEEPAWSWFGPDQTVGFTRRRQAHEALIHRLDAELTAGVVTDIDAELAADGVDEALTIMYGNAPDWAAVSASGPIGLVRCTDVDRSWHVQVQSFSGTSPNTGTTYADEPVLAVVEAGSPTFDLAGCAADLDRWFWNRLPDGPVEVTGDASAIEAVVAMGLD